ncbi:phosphatidylglycerophosphate phosphatase PTPMT2-like [Aristolochia californica]|uniref:phosphatidylglycerophosphate phosphatase PTPMT2-like n=1 Tax=Aristolochia californica TaxID=171875 RepID=UPI0035D569CD
MHIEELKEGKLGCVDEEAVSNVCHREIVLFDPKRVLIGAGARLLFYPTLLYNVVRNKIHAEFRWWDEVDEFLLLGAVPFPGDVPHLKQLGVHGVVTLNEAYETLVPTSLYHAHGIDHLVIPTRDYLFAPSFGDICRAVDFIHEIASCGKRTYVHCKAGRGRSTTVVLCYLVRHRQMTPVAAYDYVRSRRPRVLLAASQWQAVQEFYQCGSKKVKKTNFVAGPVPRSPGALIAAAQKFVAFDESSSVVVVTESDLDGYDGTHESGIVGNDIWTEWGLVYRVQFAGQAALTRISCLWIQCHARPKITPEQPGGKKSCSAEVDQLGGMGVDIPVY